jgi:hypothetical protein
MGFKFFFLFLLIEHSFITNGQTSEPMTPTNLTTGLIEYADRIWVNGYPTRLILNYGCPRYPIFIFPGLQKSGTIFGQYSA